ncbi:hypothetical protein [Actinoplanes sp. GCM10030250]|uniref:hypothetical protein n=1 Tax=Actinoplanes sp. GCM10030250 TaxID=3273376 RepID=UPI003607A767
MMRIRTISTALLALPLLTLTACGDNSTPSAAPATTAPAAPAPTEAAPVAPADSAAAPVAGTDAELCRTITSAKTILITTLSTGVDANGKVPPELSKRAMNTLSESLNAAAGNAQDTELGTAITNLAKASADAANSADPFAASSEPAFTKAGQQLDTACAKAGS